MGENMGKEKIIGCISLALAASFWGAMYVVGKFVMGYISPFVVLWIRYLIAFIILFSISYGVKKERITKTDVPSLIWLGFIGYFISNGGAFLGTHLSSAQLGALIASTPPIFTVFLAIWLLKERLTAKKITAVLLATLGVVLVVGLKFENQDGQILGAIILLIGSLAWSLYSIYVKKVKYSALFISTYATGFGFLFTTPIMIWQFQKTDLYHLSNILVWLGILYLGVVATALAFFLWNKGMQYIDAGVGSIFNFFNVVVGGLLGWIFLGEQLTWNAIIGGVLILLATIIMLSKKRLPKISGVLEHSNLTETS